MQTEQLLLQYGGLTIPASAVGYAVWAAVKKLVGSLLAQHKALMLANSKLLEDRIALLEKELLNTNQALKGATEIAHKLHTNLATVAVQIASLDKMIEKHDKGMFDLMTHMSGVRTDIGNLSMYKKS